MGAARRWLAALAAVPQLARGELLTITPARLAQLDMTLPAESNGAGDLYEVRYARLDGGITCVKRSTDVSFIKRFYTTYAPFTVPSGLTLELYDHTLGIVRASRRI